GNAAPSQHTEDCSKKSQHEGNPCEIERVAEYWVDRTEIFHSILHPTCARTRFMHCFTRARIFDWCKVSELWHWVAARSWRLSLLSSLAHNVLQIRHGTGVDV
uniref:Uncharacterized protein n=1 Tax=Ciona savignyi TaxID=51511 RepID=H2YVG6_CIOSA